jgi:long-chain acyl-CoA synthetase
MLAQPLFRHAAAKPADQIAKYDDRGQYTWRQLLGMSAGIAQLLATQTPAPAVGILLPASAAFASSFYGTLLAGKVAVPINFLMGDREVAHIIKDSGVDTILTAPPLAARLDSVPGVKVIDLTQLPSPSPDQIKIDPAAATIPGDRIATFLYTSGTSGLPKGVVLTHGNLQNDVEACIKHAQLTTQHNFLGILPLFHSTGLLATMIAPMQLGSTVTYIARFSPVATKNAIREKKISVMAAVPAMYGAMLRLKDASADDFASLYAPLSGGEPLPPTIREAFAQRFGKQLLEGYGLTETCGPVCFNTPQQHKPGSVGRPMPGGEVRIVDDNDRPLAGRDAIGEVQLRGPMIMQGYHNLPRETADAITPEGFFKTGDLGRVDADGYLFITGRKKEMIIVAGEKVFPREVEDLIAQHFAVADVAVVGKKDESRGEVVVAFVVPKEGQSTTPDEIRNFCRDNGLIAWKTPREVIVSQDLPRSPTGKVLKRVLVEQLAG